MRLNGKDWERLDDFKTPTGNESLIYKHTNLSLKDKVQYRTIAVNKAGESPPSEPSPIHTVKHKKRKFSTSTEDPPLQINNFLLNVIKRPVTCPVCPFDFIFQLWSVDLSLIAFHHFSSNYVLKSMKIEINLIFVVGPKIDRRNLDMKHAKVGQTVLIDVDVEGEPMPTTMWTLLGNEVKAEGNIKIVHSDFNTKFTIENGQRKNSKQYKVVATNEHGKDEEFVEVVFLGRPSAPMGPLEVYGITADSCKLNWRPPEDDGGKPIQKYIIEKMDMATKKWVPLGETPGDVTNIPAKGLEEGHEYLFRVKAVNEEGESEPLVADKAIKAKNAFGG